MLAFCHTVSDYVTCREYKNATLFVVKEQNGKIWFWLYTVLNTQVVRGNALLYSSTYVGENNREDIFKTIFFLPDREAEEKRYKLISSESRVRLYLEYNSMVFSSDVPERCSLVLEILEEINQFISCIGSIQSEKWPKG
jgi:hypothetical protein